MTITQLESGALLHQVTDESRLVSNIYCERPFCAADSSRFLFARQRNGGGPRDHADWEYVLCTFGTWEQTVVGRGEFNVGISYDNDFYYRRPAANGCREFVRIELATGESTVVWTTPPDAPQTGHPAISADGKRLAFHTALSYDPQRFAIVVVDLTTGAQSIVCEDPDLCNAHLQFCPVDSRTLLAQVNRGCRYSPEGEMIRRVDERGATLWLVDAVGGDVDELRIGTPHTTPITGHQAWLGATATIVATVIGRDDFAEVPGKGNVVTIERGRSHRQLAAGLCLNHVGSTPCGTYIHGDCVAGDKLAVVSPRTGAVSIIHEDPSQPGDSPFGQQSHPHAYLTPDFRWMVFNSDRTGRPQIYVAEIPASLLPD